jgi:hypothetical protein
VQLIDRLLKFAALAAFAVLVVVVIWFFWTSDGGGGPKFKVIGGPCASVTNGGVLYSSSSGFTPNGAYVTQAWINGKPVAPSDLHNPGKADAYGRTSSWHWTCAPPAGSYRFRVTDLSTGKHAEAGFTIDQFVK